MFKVKTEVQQILLGLCLLLPLAGCSTDLETLMYTYEGQDVTLHFVTARRSTVSWWFLARQSLTWMKLEVPENIYMMSDDFTGRFNPFFQHTHVIRNVRLDDAGRYLCVDSEGNDGYTELIVTENYLNCESTIGVKHSEDEQLVSYKDQKTVINIRCTIIYNGKQNPFLEWFLVKNGSVLNGLPLQEEETETIYNLTSTYPTLTSEVSLSASSWLDHSYLKCQVTEPEDAKKNAAISTVYWLSGKIKCSDAVECYIDTRYAASIETAVAVVGVTVLNEMIYVLQQKSRKLKSYNSNNLELRQNIYIPDMISPVDICSSTHSNALYISDGGEPLIHRVDPKSQRVSQWMMIESHWPHGLSMTTDHTLLVTYRIRGSEGASGVLECSSEGKQLRNVRFDRSIKYAHQTVQLSSKKFVVSQGNDHTSLHRVCLVNSEGYIVMIHGGNLGGGDDKLHLPKSMAVDRFSKQIFVADTGNNRIVLLDFHLIYRGQLSTQFSPEAPLSVFFDSSTKRLLIGEHSGRMIIISP